MTDLSSSTPAVPRPHSKGASARRVTVARSGPAVSRFSAESDYEVAFAISCSNGPRLSAEQWIRAIFEGAPRGMRWFLIVGWTAITCRLKPRRSPTRVLGWHIEDVTQNELVLVARAWVGLVSRLVVAVDVDTVRLASFVRFTGPVAAVARMVWAGTTPLHERILPSLLTSAARRNQPSTPISWWP
jgi:hypothetical protein